MHSISQVSWRASSGSRCPLFRCLVSKVGRRAYTRRAHNPIFSKSTAKLSGLCARAGALFFSVHLPAPLRLSDRASCGHHATSLSRCYWCVGTVIPSHSAYHRLSIDASTSNLPDVCGWSCLRCGGQGMVNACVCDATMSKRFWNLRVYQLDSVEAKVQALWAIYRLVSSA